MEISFKAPFEEMIYFLLIISGIIQNRHIFIFTLAARKTIGNSQINENNCVEFHEPYTISSVSLMEILLVYIFSDSDILFLTSILPFSVSLKIIFCGVM